MAVRVPVAEVLTEEVDGGPHPTGEVGVGGIHTRVDHGHDHTGTDRSRPSGGSADPGQVPLVAPTRFVTECVQCLHG